MSDNLLIARNQEASQSVRCASKPWLAKGYLSLQSILIASNQQESDHYLKKGDRKLEVVLSGQLEESRSSNVDEVMMETKIAYEEVRTLSTAFTRGAGDTLTALRVDIQE